MSRTRNFGKQAVASTAKAHDPFGQDAHIGEALVALRMVRGMSLREVCRGADLSPAALSAIERGQSSPTLATLHRILKSLGSDFASFFARRGEETSSPVYRANEMARVTDSQREVVLAFPRSAAIRFAMSKETIPAGEIEVEWETHDCDVGGVIISGGPLVVEIAGIGHWEARKGDAFYIRAGQRHRGRNIGAGPLKMICTYDPPRY